MVRGRGPAAHLNGPHLRVYSHEIPEEVRYCNPHYAEYSFHVYDNPPKREKEGRELIAAKRIPKKFHKELLDFLGHRKSVRLGRIHYSLVQGEAESHDYHPKVELNEYGPREAPGLGYYLEAITVNDLKQKKSLKGVRTTHQPSFMRIGQLHKAGLIELNEEEKALLKACRENAKEIPEHGKIELDLSEQRLIASLNSRGALPARHSFEEWLRGLGRGLRKSLKKA